MMKERKKFLSKIKVESYTIKPDIKNQGEQFVKQCLESWFDRKAKIIQNFRPNWLDYLEMDFYVIDFLNKRKRLCIEINGPFHYRIIPGRTNLNRLAAQYLRDEMKKRMCKRYGINYIEIPYENIYLSLILGLRQYYPLLNMTVSEELKTTLKEYEAKAIAKYGKAGIKYADAVEKILWYIKETDNGKKLKAYYEKKEIVLVKKYIHIIEKKKFNNKKALNAVKNRKTRKEYREGFISPSRIQLVSLPQETIAD